MDNVEHCREPLLEFRIGQRVIDDTTGCVENDDPEQVYEVNMNKAMNEYAKINRGAENYDPLEERAEIFERANQEGDYVIENVDKQLEELELNREVEEILLRMSAAEETNEVNAKDIEHEDAGEVTRDTDTTANELEQKQADSERDDNQDDSSDQVEKNSLGSRYD